MNELQRVQKLLATQGVASRREIERLILAGQLRINGKVAILGQKVSGKEDFFLNGKRLSIGRNKQIARKVLMYNKPLGEICTRYDERGRKTVFSALPKLKQQRWVSIGRLDINTTGLLLFSNDGNLVHNLSHPSNEIEREYWVRVAGAVDEATLKTLREGIMLEDGMAHFASVVALRAPHEDDTQYNRYYSCTLREGRNRLVRRLWDAVGCEVSRLKRVRFGAITLPKMLRSGEYRELTSNEINQLTRISTVNNADSTSKFKKF